jgi:hypothetical protein
MYQHYRCQHSSDEIGFDEGGHRKRRASREMLGFVASETLLEFFLGTLGVFVGKRSSTSTIY